MREGERNCLKYLLKGLEQKRGEGKPLKRGQAWSRDACLKRGGGAGTPLRTMKRAPMLGKRVLG